jgi:glycosyltransferase involved in cell wall biosynthesis
MKTDATFKQPRTKAEKTVLMLLTNAYDPDPRVRQEALALMRMGLGARILAWDRDLKAPAEEWMEGIAVERIFVRSIHGRGATQVLFYVWVYVRFFWRGMRRKFDVLHCHDLDTLPIGFLLGKLKRKPVIYDAHESFVDMLGAGIPPIMRRGLTGLENFLLRRADLVITVGEKLRRHLASRGARHSVVVGNWKRLGEFARTEAESFALRGRLGIPDGGLVVVCITQLLGDRKLKELAGAVSVCADVWLILGGKGALEPAVREWAAANPRLRYVGFLRGDDIAAYTCAADVVYYGFDPGNPNARFSAPNKLFEALAAGKPLITGDFGEIGDVVREAECGIVVPEYTQENVRNALELLRDQEVRDRLAANARRLGASAMNWEKGEEVLHREYTRLLHPRRLSSARRAQVRTGQQERADHLSADPGERTC